MRGRVVVLKETELPVEAMEALVTASSREGQRFAQTLLKEWKAQEGFFARPVEGVFVAWEASRVIGMCGVRPPGLLDPLYVIPERRRRGVGRELWSRASALARKKFPDVKARASTPDARAFLDAMGFERFGGPGGVTHRWSG